MANERAAMERKMAQLRQSSAAPARHARFGGIFVKRYHSEDRGTVMRSNPLASSLPAIPQLKKTIKTQVMYRPHVYHVCHVLAQVMLHMSLFVCLTDTGQRALAKGVGKACTLMLVSEGSASSKM